MSANNALTVSEPSRGTFKKDTFKNQFGSRDFYIYTPKKYNRREGVGLVVALHGCTQSVAEFSAQTGFNNIAEKYDFVVVYPEQTYADNILKCWNWFKPENHTRSGGESSILVGIVNKVKKEIKVNPEKVFIMGLSAGGAMAANVYGCYSDVFKGVGIHSGLEFRAAINEIEAQQVIKTGPSQDINESAGAAILCSKKQAKMRSVFVIHGANDTVVNPINATRAVTQFSKINDLLDDSIDNDSQNPEPISSTEKKVPNGYRYEVQLSGGRKSIQVANVKVIGMGHAWSGAHQAGQYADPKGPDAAELMWLFLTRELKL